MSEKWLRRFQFVSALTIILVFSAHAFGQFPNRQGALNQVLSRQPVRSILQSQVLGQPVFNQQRHRLVDAAFNLPLHVPTTPPVFHHPVHTQPVHVHPVYTQPAVLQPVFSQSIHGNSVSVLMPPQPVAQPAPVTTADLARQKSNQAKDYFARGSYKTTVQLLNDVIRLAPEDINALQFSSLAEFASGNFESSAADAYDTFSKGNAWTAGSLKLLYGESFATYQQHLIALETNSLETPSMETHFLLAYHYIMNERWQEAQLRLESVLEIKQDEGLSTKLLAVVKQQLAKPENPSK